MNKFEKINELVGKYMALIVLVVACISLFFLFGIIFQGHFWLLYTSIGTISKVAKSFYLSEKPCTD
ncbi:MAG: hypothetical protein IJ877_06740 [Candidatus Gastranaerophilales bacterium]|nr:hypothetical protein [Candidatus Gastranaerophilales bacterium]